MGLLSGVLVGLYVGASDGVLVGIAVSTGAGVGLDGDNSMGLEL